MYMGEVVRVLRVLGESLQGFQIAKVETGDRVGCVTCCSGDLLMY